MYGLSMLRSNPSGDFDVIVSCKNLGGTLSGLY